MNVIFAFYTAEKRTNFSCLKFSSQNAEEKRRRQGIFFFLIERSHFLFACGYKLQGKSLKKHLDNSQAIEYSKSVFNNNV